LLGQELSKDQLRSLLQSGTLATRLRNRTALAFIEFEEAQDGVTYPRINELQPADNSKPPQPPPSSPPRSYEQVFGADEGPAPKPNGDPTELPF
jgi:hypothetical protein